MNKPFSTKQVKKIPLQKIRIQDNSRWMPDPGWSYRNGFDPKANIVFWQEWTVEYLTVNNNSRFPTWVMKLFFKERLFKWEKYKSYKQEDAARAAADALYAQGYVEIDEMINEVSLLSS